MAGAVAIRRFAVSSQQISIGIECWKRGLGEAGKRPCTEQVAQSALRFPLGIAARRCEAEAGAMGRHPCKHTRRMNPERAEAGIPRNELRSAWLR